MDWLNKAYGEFMANLPDHSPGSKGYYRAGAIAAMFTSWFAFSKPDLSMALNGTLAGLVGITAGADVVSIGASVVIGLVAGVLVFMLGTKMLGGDGGSA